MFANSEKIFENCRPQILFCFRFDIFLLNLFRPLQTFSSNIMNTNNKLFHDFFFSLKSFVVIGSPNFFSHLFDVIVIQVAIVTVADFIFF